jgi:hypothetical protein
MIHIIWWLSYEYNYNCISIKAYDVHIIIGYIT